MAEKKSASVDPEALYRVTLRKATTFRGQVVRPRDDFKIKGRFIAELDEAAVEKTEKLT